jgi:hypothetical protein
LPRTPSPRVVNVLLRASVVLFRHGILVAMYRLFAKFTFAGGGKRERMVVT